MARMIAIDYGRKRIGLAVTDEIHKLITPLSQIQFNQKNSWTELFRAIQENHPQKIIIGDPDFQKNQQVRQEILDFTKKLRKLFPEVIFTFVDESYSSKEAREILSEINGYGLKKIKKKKNKLDSIAAALILQRYLKS